MKYWNDLAFCFGTHRPNITSEFRVFTPLEEQVLDDALICPRFTVLRLVLALSECEFDMCLQEAFPVPNFRCYFLFFLGVVVCGTSDHFIIVIARLVLF